MADKSPVVVASVNKTQETFEMADFDEDNFEDFLNQELADTNNNEDLLNSDHDHEEKNVIDITQETATAGLTEEDATKVQTNALNDSDKMKKRMERFGTTTNKTELSKVEERKRRFGTTTIVDDPANAMSAAKKRKLNEEDRQKVVARAKKFGTKVPGNITLTVEEQTDIYKDEIARAERFGTQHLLPNRFRQAQFNEQKEKRKKRFGTGGDIEKSNEEKNDKKQTKKGHIICDFETDEVKLAQRRLRFGTSEKKQQNFNGKKKFNTNKFKKQWVKKNNNNMNANNNNNNNNGFSAADQAKIQQRKQRFANMQ